jgi:hypothetical protein
LESEATMHIKEPRVQLDHMLLQTRRQLIDFSIMADTKANILLSISSVITTLVLTRATDPRLMKAAFVLLGFLLMTALMALLTLIPNIRTFGKQKRSVNDPDFNPLFFGDYAHVGFDDYRGHMEDILNDPDRTYEIQIKELYYAGRYLQNTKYNYVKLGYIFFFAGLIVSSVVYFLENLL